MTRALFVLAALLALATACSGNGSSDDSDGDGGTGGNTDGDTDADTDADADADTDTGYDCAAEVCFTIDPGANVHPISRYIYGTNQPDWAGRSAHLTLGRLGGNRWTAYNWETNASNAGADWNYSNDDYLGGGDVAGEAVRSKVKAAFDAGAAAIVTVPIQGLVSADKDGPVDVSSPPDMARFEISAPVKGSAFSLTPDTGDGHVYEDEFASWLSHTFPGAETDPVNTLFFALDNEPDLWMSTHVEVHPDPATYEELVQDNTDYADAIKSVLPGARVFGFVSYGWSGYVNLQNDAEYTAHGDFLDYYLDAMSAAGTAAGHRLIDVLDLHWYPEAQGDGIRIIGDETTAGVVEARVQAPRSLWDDTYTEESWITQWSTMGPIRLIPRMKEKIAAHYTGTELAFTEYWYGAGGHISGALAEADALGIFGREGVFEASVWEMGSDLSFLYAAFRMYLDYDGAGGAFGDTSIRAITNDIESTSVYASVDEGEADRMVIVAINKSGAPITAGVHVDHAAAFGHARVWQLTSSQAGPVAQPDATIPGANSFEVTLPAQSVVTLELAP
ncbi:MAG: glycoside hydrolase family 44 protein [Deltaproteobacteria bacterium]|nr:glycoside hydrolase family 44 protein [Deltaproteobacteria bacterium]